jgi:HEAT repeat protein
MEASEALKVKDPRIVDSLIAALQSQNPHIREGAARALSQIKDPRSVDSLIAALGDTNPEVQIQAVIGLGNIRDPRAVGPLIAAMRSRDDNVSFDAELSLKEIGPPAVDLLIATLRGRDRLLQVNAAVALNEIDDPRAASAVEAALKPLFASHYLMFFGKGRESTAGPLIRALRDFGNPRMAVDFLNCGNWAMEHAGKEWLEKHGRTVVETDQSPGTPRF